MSTSLTANETIEPRPAREPRSAEARLTNGLLELLPVLLQVALVAGLLAAFQVESPAFHRRVVPMVAAGFVVHHFLSLRARLPFFVALSVATIWTVFGATQALWLVGVGAGLLAVCHLPVGYWWRVVLLLSLGAWLAVARAGLVPTPWSGAIWPVLGSMFMFRLVAYMYHLRHQPGPVEWTRAAAYFFMLPNVSFPLFPVVDYATFKRTWFDKPAPAIYREGVAWILRGVVHLLAYRVIYERFTLSPRDVHTLGDYVQYAVANFGLYLRVSGQFHLIVGMLHLFGFRLPETHKFFYLATSFSDFWRRINIYWKDFMMKVVFYPTFFASKKWGERAGLVLSVCAVFAVSWVTHSWQWFWILGEWLFSATDAVFWGLFGSIMVYASLRELRQGRQRQLGASRPSWRRSAHAALGTVGVFSLICALWTLWNSPDFGSYFETLRAARFTWSGLGGLALVLLVLFLASMLVQRFVPQGSATSPRQLRLTTWGNLAALAVLWGAGESRIAACLPPIVGAVALDVRAVDLNRRDADELQRGYYENLTGVSARNGQLWDLYAQRSADAPTLKDLGVLLDREDALHTELAPLKSVTFEGASLRTNRWGMRDVDYAERPAASTWRVALLGQSYVLGMGVGDREVFEGLAERSLDSERRARGLGGFEILNFAMPRWSLAQQALILQNGRVARFRPRAVVVVGHALDFDRLIDWVYVEARARRPIGDSTIQAAVDANGLADVASSKTAQQLLYPLRQHLARWALTRVATAARAGGAERVLYVAIPMPTDRQPREEVELIMRIARESGLEVHDLSGVYEGREERTLTVAPWDRHPNALGHRLIAAKFESLLRRELLAAPAGYATPAR